MADEQQYILRWHHHESTLLSGLPRLLEADVLTDITLSAGRGHVKAHRLVLATCSAYFLELFREAPTMQHPIVVLKDMDYDDLCCLISFMYGGQCRISANRLQSVLAMARVLRIRGLCDMTAPIIDGTLTQSSTSPTVLSVAKPEPSPSEGDVNGNSYTFTSDTAKVSVPKVRITQPTPTECRVCGKQLSNQYNLRVHLETHENGQHACALCPHVSRSRDALRKHVSYRHPELADAASPPRKKNKASALQPPVII